MEHVQDTHRLALMNLMLHGISSSGHHGGIRYGDTVSPEGEALPKATLILTNPPFGTKKGGLPTRTDFTFPTSNKQFCFLQHIYRSLKPAGRAAVVMPDNVLFESNVGTDTHLNPVWTYDFLRLLQDNIRAEKGQLIVATHNPLMIGSLHKNQVRVLTQTEASITAAEPEYDPIGIGVEGPLKSELYGLRSTLAPDLLEKPDRHYLLIGKADKSDDEYLELMALANELNELGVARTHPNPYFEQFTNAMARRRPTTDSALSKAEIDAQTQLADEVLAEILAEESATSTGGNS